MEWLYGMCIQVSQFGPEFVCNGTEILLLVEPGRQRVARLHQVGDLQELVLSEDDPLWGRWTRDRTPEVIASLCGGGRGAVLWEGRGSHGE